MLGSPKLQSLAELSLRHSDVFPTSSPISRLELTKPICLCESAEKYSTFIRVKGYGIGQCQSAEVFPQLWVHTACTGRRLYFLLPFTRQDDLHQIDDATPSVRGQGCQTSLFSSAGNANKWENAIKQHTPQHSGCEQLGEVRKSLILFSSKMKWEAPPTSSSVPFATTLVQASQSVGSCVGGCSQWLTTEQFKACG